MDYADIHKALKDAGLTWATAADAIGSSPSSVMAVAKRTGKSRPVALRLALLIGKDVIEVFPDMPAYSEPDEKEKRQAIVEAARRRLEQAGAPALNTQSA